jgi:nucleoside-diphosphate-sugar epimerase
MHSRAAERAFWRGRAVLVGGGCGLIGSYLTPLLVEWGARVTVVDDLSTGQASVLDQYRDRLTFIVGDLRDVNACGDWLQNQDTFINLAARVSGVGFSRANHATMLMDNLLCGLAPLEAARAHRIRQAVVISSSCVYDDAAPVPTPELDAFAGRPERVNEGYGWAKRIEELAASYLRHETSMMVTVLRPFNVYGANYPWRSQERAQVIPSLVKRVLDGEDPLIVWGTGRQRRNFLHGADAAYVMLRVIESGAAGPVNVGYEEDTSIAELVGLVCEITGRRPEVRFDTSKPDGQPRKSADATLLRALTDNYSPQVSLREGLAEMVRWYERTFAARS